MTGVIDFRTVRLVSTKTKTETPEIDLNAMCSIAIRRRGHLMAKTGALVLNKELRAVIEEAIEFYLSRKSPRSIEIFNEQHGKVGV